MKEDDIEENLENDTTKKTHTNGFSNFEKNAFLNRSYQEICSVKSPECAKYCKSMDDLILKDSHVSKKKQQNLFSCYLHFQLSCLLLRNFINNFFFILY